MAEKRKRSLPAVSQKKIKLNQQEELPEVDNTRKEINKFFSKLISKDARDRVKLTQKILGLIGDDLLSACNKHDLSRVVQACLKHGSDQQKALIFESLYPSFSELAAGKYSYYLAKKLMKYGNKEEMLEQVLENSKKMIGSAYGVRFLELMYLEGHKSKIFHALLGDEVEGRYDGEKIRELKNCLSFKKIVKKGLLEYQLILHLLYLYTLYSEDQENYEVYSGISEKFSSMFKSRYGTTLAVRSLAVSDTKQRKIILKTVQPLITQISDQESYAYLFFIKLIQVIDDTTRVNKMISTAINQNMNSFILSSTGVKFLSSICPFAGPQHALSPTELEVIDEELNTLSKKPVETKQKEVFSFIFNMLAREVSANIKEIINDPRRNNAVIIAALGVINDVGKSNEFVEKCSACAADWQVMDNNVGHRVLKKIIEAEVEKNGKIFTKAVFHSLKAKGDYLGKLVKSRGVWVLVSLVEKSSLKNKCKKLIRAFLNVLSMDKAGEKALFENLKGKTEKD
jgi:pumilio family protein 6